MCCDVMERDRLRWVRWDGMGWDGSWDGLAPFCVPRVAPFSPRACQDDRTKKRAYEDEKQEACDRLPVSHAPPKHIQVLRHRLQLECGEFAITVLDRCKGRDMAGMDANHYSLTPFHLTPPTKTLPVVSRLFTSHLVIAFSKLHSVARRTAPIQRREYSGEPIRGRWGPHWCDGTSLELERLRCFCIKRNKRGCSLLHPCEEIACEEEW